jgi:hypothetical protein
MIVNTSKINYRQSVLVVNSMLETWIYRNSQKNRTIYVIVTDIMLCKGILIKTDVLHYCGGYSGVGIYLVMCR